jgi:hypothetical protein
VVLLLVALAAFVPGCGKKAPESANYFGLAEGNSWLYEGAALGQSMQVQMTVTKPDSSLNLRPGILDLSISGSLGNFNIGAQGLFLEVTSDEVKLWGVEQGGAPPQFFNAPYVWLKKPLEVGQQYNTAVQGEPTPALMTVTGKQSVSTPWGAKEAFLLEEAGGAGPAGGVKLAFVPYLGFTTITLPDIPELRIKDTSLE